MDAGTPVRVHAVHDAAGARRVVAVIETIWAGGAGIDANTIVALAHSGNYVVIAEHDGADVGAGLGFFGPPGNATLHSHIVGATERGAGRVIKHHQRAWCAERGVGSITWTFDPLVARNAWFNLSVLGARPVEYLVDHYGELRDEINAGQPSDRILLTWPVAPAPDPPAPPDPELVIEIPADIEALRRTDPDAARAWRLRTRERFVAAFAAGLSATGFVRPAGGRGGAYTFAHQESR